MMKNQTCNNWVNISFLNGTRHFKDSVWDIVLENQHSCISISLLFNKINFTWRTRKTNFKKYGLITYFLSNFCIIKINVNNSRLLTRRFSVDKKFSIVSYVFSKCHAKSTNSKLCNIVVYSLIRLFHKNRLVLRYLANLSGNSTLKVPNTTWIYLLCISSPV